MSISSPDADPQRPGPAAPPASAFPAAARGPVAGHGHAAPRLARAATRSDAAAAPRARARTNRAALPFTAERCPTLEDFVGRVAALYGARSLPFHAPSWIDAWYRSFGAEPGCEPLWVAVRRPGLAGDAVLLPLVSRRRHGLRVVGFADGGVVDYVAPVLAPGWSQGLTDKAAAQALWRALRPVLRGHDALVVHKLLPRLMEEAGGGVNPLALVLRTKPCQMFGNQFVVDSDGAAPGAAPPPPAAGGAGAGAGEADADAAWERWRRSLDKRTRKEIERSWRVFHRSPQARFEAVTDPAQALALLQTLEAQQRQRMQELGQDYRLDTPACREFYRLALAGGLHGGSPAGPVVMTALRDGEHVVSALFGLANGHRYLGLRQSLGGAAWKACSPARLLDEHTARHLHAQGCTHFDFGIGDYAHKQALRMTAIPLLDGCRALRPGGTAVVALWRLRAWARSHPSLRSAWQRWRGRQRPGARAGGPALPSSADGGGARAD